jgi:hypothetical protein
MRFRSWAFVLTGALGGLVGFAVMEAVSRQVPGAGTGGTILQMSIYFSGFGLAVGAALGMTEGAVLRRPGRLIYGLLIGLVLGALGGFAGGALGQAIYGLAPIRYAVRSNTDLAIVLDSSGSMRLAFFFGSDPHGERRTASKRLVDRLSTTDRVAIVDFDTVGTVIFPLTALRSDAERSAAKAAIDRIDDSGGTDLSAGLNAGIGELVRHKVAGRRQFIIFLTDGDGYYTPRSAEWAHRSGISIYTIGLGPEAAGTVLKSVAAETGGRYYPVQDAAALTQLFEGILTRDIGAMTAAQAPGKPAPDAELLTSPALILLVRILSWAAMGLAIGLGQGVRENSREDLFACSIGGLLGGAAAGALFNPVAGLVTLGAGLAGRALADVVVGACIGGSMRLAQSAMAEMSGGKVTTLAAFLPPKVGLSFADPARDAVQRPVRAGFDGNARPAGQSPAVRAAAPYTHFTGDEDRRDAPPPALPPGSGLTPPVAPPGTDPARPAVARPASSRPPLAAFAAATTRDAAMAKAYAAGYSLREVAEHFGVTPTAVKRATQDQGGR